MMQNLITSLETIDILQHRSVFSVKKLNLFVTFFKLLSIKKYVLFRHFTLAQFSSRIKECTKSIKMNNSYSFFLYFLSSPKAKTCLARKIH